MKLGGVLLFPLKGSPGGEIKQESIIDGVFRVVLSMIDVCVFCVCLVSVCIVCGSCV